MVNAWYKKGRSTRCPRAIPPWLVASMLQSACTYCQEYKATAGCCMTLDCLDSTLGYTLQNVAPACLVRVGLLLHVARVLPTKHLSTSRLG